MVALALAGSMACGDDEPERRTFQDIGDFCVKSEPDGRLTFTVTVGAVGRPCLSGCRINTASCQATLTGDRIELLSQLEIRENPGVDVCPAACIITTGTCELAAPAPGDYDFGFASRFEARALPTSPTEGCAPLFADAAD
ncbi:MAG TPA: hypothetical protein VMG12_01460 [Polyangiaceae bacterium]|nr:hypothetical protein [Polyangiaceae bacterium]